MAGEAATLYHLQLLDLEIEAKQRDIRDSEAKVGESTALREARRQTADAEANRLKIERQMRQLEGEIDNRADKIGELEKRLFGGGVDKQRQAGAIERELAALKRDRGELEDRLLEAMSVSEELPAEIARLKAAEQQQVAVWKTDQQRLESRLEHSRRELSALQERRQATVTGLPGAGLAKYEELRRTRGGLAVAKVERNTCMGCRVTLPMGEAQRARASINLSFCSFCGRILHFER